MTAKKSAGAKLLAQWFCRRGSTESGTYRIIDIGKTGRRFVVEMKKQDSLGDDRWDLADPSDALTALGFALTEGDLKVGRRGSGATLRCGD